MDALTRAAITGTSREAPPASGLPTDNLLRSAEGNSPERDLPGRRTQGRDRRGTASASSLGDTSGLFREGCGVGRRPSNEAA
jgi:hypothetical protein